MEHQLMNIQKYTNAEKQKNQKCKKTQKVQKKAKQAEDETGYAILD